MRTPLNLASSGFFIATFLILTTLPTSALASGASQSTPGSATLRARYSSGAYLTTVLVAMLALWRARSRPDVRVQPRPVQESRKVELVET